jgi:hypothetical protein
MSKFNMVGRPIRLKTAMLNAKENLNQGKADFGKRSEGDMVALIAQLDSLRKHGVLSEEEFNRRKMIYWQGSEP